jgi:beta-galactosidase
MSFIKSVKYVNRISVFSFLFGLLLVTTVWADSRVDTVINNTWKFNKADVANAQLPSFDDTSWITLDLPHTWNALDGEDGGNNYYRGIGWYRKHYTIGSENSGKRVYLFFESVGISADVYCNGTLVGSHLGAYAAFCFDITSAVSFGAENLIAVKANNSSSLNIAPLSGDFTQWGGICRSVHLLITNPVHITPLDYASLGVYLTPTDVNSTSSNLSVKTLIRNTGATAKDVLVRATIKDANNITVGTPLTLTQSVAAGATTNFIQNTTVSNPHLWDGLADPYLYKVLVEVETDSAVVDSVEQPLGFRYYYVDANTGFFLNGHYLDLHGAAIHEDRDHKGRAISDADRAEDMQIMLDMGCTWLRLSHYQHAEKMYDLADAAGMILTTEIPLVNLISTTQAFSDNCQSQLKELIRQNYNHPSVLYWGLFNEITLSGGPDSNPLITTLNTLAHAEDPTRPTTAANNTSDTDATSKHTDVLGYNKYFGWYNGAATDFAGWADGIHSTRGSDKIGVTEYGAGASINNHEENPPEPPNAGHWHPEEYQSYYHEVHWKAMKTRPFLWCKAIWNGFDFGSDGRAEGDHNGINDKGLVLRDRTVKKDAYFWYQANWSSTPMVYITSRRFTPRTANPTYVKVYSNCDSVELFINGVSKGVLTSTDHIYQWTSGLTLATGANEIRAIGQIGANQYTDVCSWTLNPPGVQAPYLGSPSAIPGKIEAENFDLGGEGVAYHDTDAGNSGGQYRPSESVDIQACTDTGGGYNIGWTATGEWLEYTVNVAAAGSYTIGTRVAAQSTGGSFYIAFDGVNKTGTVTVPATGGWQNWTTVNSTVSLSAGTQIMRFYIVARGNGFNLNYFNLTANFTVTVPNVIGMSQSNAQSAITTAGLAVGTISQSYSDTVAAGNVISQDPAGGSSAAPGSSVSLVVSLGIRGDLNHDGTVDINDLGIMAVAWLTSDITADIEPASGNGIVDLKDFAILAENWLAISSL